MLHEVLHGMCPVRVRMSGLDRGVHLSHSCAHCVPVREDVGAGEGSWVGALTRGAVRGYNRDVAVAEAGPLDPYGTQGWHYITSVRTLKLGAQRVICERGGKRTRSR